MADYPYSDFGSVHDCTVEEFMATHPQEIQSTKITPLTAEKTNGQYAAAFNNLCQIHGITKAFFTFPEATKSCFGVKVEFGERILEDSGPFASKKQAKEVICAQGVELLRSLDKPNKVKHKGNTMAENAEVQCRAAEVDDSENWSGILVHAVQTKVIKQPTERYFEADTKHLQRQGLASSNRQFSVAMTIDDFGVVFGGQDMLFPSKALAKRNAAREAVLYLRNNGHLTAEQQLTKRSRLDQDSIDNAEEGHTGLSQVMEQTKANESSAAQVHELAVQLGFSVPAYVVKATTPPPGAVSAPAGPFISMAATFNEVDARREARLAGPVGEVRRVFGKKTAKEQCAREVLKVLEAIKADRIAQAESMI